jgi:hypothetical protein
MGEGVAQVMTGCPWMGRASVPVTLEERPPPLMVSVSDPVGDVGAFDATATGMAIGAEAPTARVVVLVQLKSVPPELVVQVQPFDVNDEVLTTIPVGSTPVTSREEPRDSEPSFSTLMVI